MTELSAFQYGLETALRRRGYTGEDLAKLPDVCAELEKQALWPAAVAFGLPAAAGLGLVNLGMHVAKPLVVDVPSNLGASVGDSAASALDPDDPVGDYKATQLKSELQFQTADVRRRLRARLRQMLAADPNLDISGAV